MIAKPRSPRFGAAFTRRGASLCCQVPVAAGFFQCTGVGTVPLAAVGRLVQEGGQITRTSHSARGTSAAASPLFSAQKRKPRRLRGAAGRV